MLLLFCKLHAVGGTLVYRTCYQYKSIIVPCTPCIRYCLSTILYINLLCNTDDALAMFVSLVFRSRSCRVGLALSFDSHQCSATTGAAWYGLHINIMLVDKYVRLLCIEHSVKWLFIYFDTQVNKTQVFSRYTWIQINFQWNNSI